MAGSSGGGDNATTTTTTPWAGQIPYLSGAYGMYQPTGFPGVFPEAARLYQEHTPEYYPGAQVAPQQAGTTAAQDYLWQYAGGGQGPAPRAQGGPQAAAGAAPQALPQAPPANTPAAPGTLPALAGAAQGANQFLLDPSLLYADSNPAMQSYIDAATRPVYQGLTEVALPGIQSDYATAGQYGGSRQGIAEGLAISRAGDTAGDISARIASQGYGQGLEAQARGLALAPQTGAFGAAPAQYLDAIGQQNQLYTQALIDADMRRHSFEQQLPYERLREYASIVAGPGYGGVSTTEGPGSRTSSALTALGGAATGASLGASLAPGNPWGTGIGAGVGLLAGLFG